MIIIFPGNDKVVFPQTDSDVNTEELEPQAYNASNNVPMGVTHYRDRLIVTVPRRRVGIPSTLNVINVNEPKGSSPLFQPFPDSKTNSLHVS